MINTVMSEEERVPAGFWIRVCAWVLDDIFILGVYSCFMAPILLITSHILWSAVVLIVTLFPLCGILPVYWWGQSIGKMILSLQIIRPDSDRISFKHSVIRYLSSLLSGLLFNIGYLMVAFSGNKRGLHDRLANTYVVYQSTPARRRRASIAAMIAFGVLGPSLVWWYAFTNQKFSRSFAYWSQGLFIKNNSQTMSAKATIQTPYETAQKSKVEWSELKLNNQRINNLSRLGEWRSSLSMYCGDNDGSYPADPRAVVPKYMKRIPELQLPDHGKTTSVTLYNNTVCQGEDSISPSKIRDTGAWGYVSDPDAPCRGMLFIDCTHTDSKGKKWHTN